MQIIKKVLLSLVLLCSLCYIGGYSTSVYAGTTEASTTETETVKTRKFSTNDKNNTMKTKDIWTACQNAIQEYQTEINLITNILIAAFLVIAAIVFVIVCIRLTTIESHPLAKKQEYMSLLYTIVCVAGLGGVAIFAKFIIFLALGIN